MRKLEDVVFDNLTLRSLPIDPEERTYERQVRGACFSRVRPAPVKNPVLVAVSAPALALLDIDPEEAKRPDFAEYFSGNRLLPGWEPAAHCYCGYQFGHFSGQLGDGAAMYLGEVVNSKGERWELQFKGAGPTPYSRNGADGRKVLRSSLREFLCSEAMHGLGIPTTRAATVVTSDSRVARDIHYSGDIIQERVTVITRLAPTFLRFGSFEIFRPQDSATGRKGPSCGLEAELLPLLTHFVIRTYFPEIWAAHGGDEAVDKGDQASRESLYSAWFREVVLRTARLAAQWQCVGWCHGVLNTDNMSILGITLDYGPFGFLDRYDPDHVCNGSDDGGRYDYKKQPEMCAWNCAKLGEALAPLLSRQAREMVLAEFDRAYDGEYWSRMRLKLGLLQPASEEQQRQDRELLRGLLATMRDTGADFSSSFRALALVDMPGLQEGAEGSAGASPELFNRALEVLVSHTADLDSLIKASKPRIPAESLNMLMMVAMKDPAMLEAMGLSPQDVLREAEKARAVEKLKKVQPDERLALIREQWSAWLRRYVERLAVEARAGGQQQERVRAMNSVNPKYILRNWIAQRAIEQAEQGDFSEVAHVLELLQQPFAESTDPEAEVAHPLCELRARYGGKPPAWAADLCVTCSS